SWRREKWQRQIKRRTRWRKSKGKGGRKWPKEEKSTSLGSLEMYLMRLAEMCGFTMEHTGRFARIQAFRRLKIYICG
ncbi:hypothetical protein ATANTOWER_009888, partial [Ataeniobius toweri]|nr:hypothetical protein [Ataeniobius toweri]